MRAAVIREHGDYDRIHVEDLPDPVPAPGEVVVRVHAAGVNHLDVWRLVGRPGLEIAWPHILGSDCAGVVESLGEGVSGLREGDEVILNPGIGCGECAACRRGEQSECASFVIVGLGRPGTFAERVALPARSLHPKPAHLNWKEAGALPLAHVTAYRMLFTRARVQPGERVLIHGVGGGVAMAALQLAVLAGVQVIATTSTALKMRFARTLGADHVLNYRTDDVAKAVMDLTGGEGVDAVLDVAGAATWALNLEVVRRGGRIVTCGVTTGAEAPTALSTLYGKQVAVMGSKMGSEEDFRRMLEAVNVARLKPIVGAVEPLERANQAVNRLKLNLQVGKTVLRIV